MSDFGSDLTDLDDEVNTKSKAPMYKLRGSLKAPRPTTYSASTLHDQIIGGDIDLEAEYQRDVVWPSVKQIGIIDSIFRNFYVPPVIFAVKYHEDGSERRVCIDGKQRLTSIQRFMDGEIPYRDAFTGEKFFYKDLPGRTEKGKPLPEKYRKIFRYKQIVCMEYQDLSGDDEREIFQRVQLGMALTPAEKLQAISSPAVTFIRTLQHTYVQGNLAEKLEWDVSRGSDFRGLAFAVFSIDRWPLDTVPSLSTVTKWLQNDRELEDNFCAKVHETFQIFVALAEDPNLKSCFTLKGVKKVSPAEFMAIAVLISQFRNVFTMAQLSEAITQMRLDIRKVEVDIRMNSRVVKPMIAFIKGLKVKQLKSSSEGPKAAKAIQEAQAKSGSSSQIRKRKRAELSDNEDDDDQHQGLKKLSISSPKSAPSKDRLIIKPEPSSQSLALTPPTSNSSKPFSKSLLINENNSSLQPSQPSLGPSVSASPQIHPDRLAAIRLAQQEVTQRSVPQSQHLSHPLPAQPHFNAWQAQSPPQNVTSSQARMSMHGYQQSVQNQAPAQNAQVLANALRARMAGLTPDGGAPYDHRVLPPYSISPAGPTQDPRPNRPGPAGAERITGANAIPVGRRDSVSNPSHGGYPPQNSVYGQGQGHGL